MKQVLIIFGFLFVLKASAQDILPFDFGILGSMSSTSVSTNVDLKDQVAGTGYNVGGLIRIKVPIVYIQGELTYGTKSVSITTSESTISSNTVYKLSGFDASAIVGIKILPLPAIGNVHLFTGYNWNQYSDITYTVNGETFSADNVNNQNSSIIAGLGCDVWKLSADIKYMFGLTDLAKSDQVKVETNVFNLTIGYRFK